MWTYEQATGFLINAAGLKVAKGYSGFGDAKNNPARQNIHSQGPIPQGSYLIDAPVDTVTHGPYVLRLEPLPSNNMFGRSGFLIHGDSVVNPGTASEGCIILGHVAREAVWESLDHVLEVVSGQSVAIDPSMGVD